VVQTGGRLGLFVEALKVARVMPARGSTFRATRRFSESCAAS
jgi:hypothetical protein